MTGLSLMLLVLLLNMDKLNDEFKEYSFRDLFDLQTGIVEDKYLPKSAKNKYNIEFLKINSFNEDGSLAEIMKSPIAQKKFGKVGNATNAKKNELKEVSEEKIIQENDFLIYTRGKPRGFSAHKFSKDLNPKYVATHHFIYLRPRLNVLDINLSYLHLMVDLFIQKQLTENYERKIIKNKSSQNIGNSISIKELKDLKIKLLKDRSAQDQVVEEYKLKLQQYQESLKSLETLENEIYNNDYEIEKNNGV